jgi:thiol-disulfide isomerase/thioredoxin
MKKLLFSLVAVLALFSCGQQTNYTINGTVKGIEDGSMVVLSRLESRQSIPVDSITIQDGIFKLRGNQEPDRYRLTVAGVPSSFTFYITGTSEEMDIILDAEDMQKSMILGSAINEKNVAFEKEVNDISASIEELMTDYSQKRKEISENEKLKTAEKNQQLEVLDEEIGEEYEALDEKKNAAVKQFVTDNINNIAGQKMFLQMPYVFDAEELESLVAKIENKTTRYAMDIVARLTDVLNSMVGKPYIDVALNDPEDLQVELSSWIKEGNYTLIDFWASWCGPCRRENPNVVAMYKKYHDKGFDIIGISRDRNREAWVKAIADDGLVWNHLWDKDADAAKSYAVDFIPTMFLLDQDGVIIARGIRGEALRDKLAEIFGE